MRKKSKEEPISLRGLKTNSNIYKKKKTNYDIDNRNMNEEEAKEDEDKDIVREMEETSMKYKNTPSCIENMYLSSSDGNCKSCPKNNFSNSGSTSINDCQKCPDGTLYNKNSKLCAVSSEYTKYPPSPTDKPTKFPTISKQCDSHSADPHKNVAYLKIAKQLRFESVL